MGERRGGEAGPDEGWLAEVLAGLLLVLMALW
jgi:hypothetical protein